MSDQELFALIDKFAASGLTSLSLRKKDWSVELSKGGSAPAAPAAFTEPSQSAPAAPAVTGEVLTAPLVGVYYAAPAPDAEPFVKVGDRVEQGQTVCLLEAMKMMSEVKAPCGCIVEEIYGKNGELVEFGAPILRYRPV